MAAYGLTNGSNSPGVVGFTGFTPTLSTGQANTPATTGAVYYNGIGQDDAKLARIFRKGGASKAFRAIWLALNGVAAGGSASSTYKRITAVAGEQPNGLIPIETVTAISRVTTAADATAITALFNRVVQPSTYVADASGNGGGGKLGLF